MNDFDEYRRLGEPEKAEKSEIWRAAIGLQQVDGLTTSEYLIETAKQNIEGAITICLPTIPGIFATHWFGRITTTTRRTSTRRLNF